MISLLRINRTEKELLETERQILSRKLIDVEVEGAEASKQVDALRDTLHRLKEVSIYYIDTDRSARNLRLRIVKDYRCLSNNVSRLLSWCLSFRMQNIILIIFNCSQTKFVAIILVL